MEKLVNVVTVFMIILITGLIVMFFVIAGTNMERKQMESEGTEIDSTWVQDQVSKQQNLEIQQNMLDQQKMQPIIVME